MPYCAPPNTTEYRHLSVVNPSSCDLSNDDRPALGTELFWVRLQNHEFAELWYALIVLGSQFNTCCLR